MNRDATLRRSRRSFLKSVGAAATVLPFYRAIESQAIGAEQPARFVGVYIPNGIAAPLYNFEGVLAPLAPLRNKVTVIEGMDLGAGVEKNTNGHDASCIMLTGTAPTGQQVANESLDQYLAVTKGLGKSTPVSSLVLGVGYAGSDSGRNISYAKSGSPLSQIIDPSKTYSLLFGTTAQPGDPGGQATVDRLLKRRQSILGYVKDDIKRFEARLAGPERVKLQQHLESLADIEKELQPKAPTPTSPMMPAGGCAAPAAPDKAGFPKTAAYNGGTPYLEKIFDLQVDLLAQAIACDRTRFATLFVYYACGPAAKNLSDAEWIHNNVAHTYSAANPSNLGEYNKFYFAKCARLFQKLNDFGVLDSSLVYVTSDMGDPALHSLRGVPTVLAGGLGGKIKMGQRVVAKGRSNNKLLVSIANAFGDPITKYGVGSAAVTDGALAELG